ncbi:winged helix-turn-helix domain-containing protein [Sphingomonas sabuli]|uniref:Winged helix-turn-helix domain-containing protein n=1 Tax=Sphingomonas sabuli TaxID=2764186 RepID=A0A7G9L0S1_9SPHN|nr:helix-turn-helix domain-containing protein [Sphingomonas sabuli]QNM82220.1 winged helix-turn-helix domain-containing protein [Sphingomonas sabuli]
MAFAQRPTVTNILNAMQAAGRIELSRGKITVIDRDALRHTAAGSYGLPEAYWCAQIGPYRFGATPDDSSIAA